MNPRNLLLAATLSPLGPVVAPAQESIERPVRTVGRSSPLTGEGMATITAAPGGSYEVRIDLLELSLKSWAKPQEVLGFRVGLLGPQRRANR